MSAIIEEFEQLSLFTLFQDDDTAINCLTGEKYHTSPPSQLALNLEPQAECIITIGNHTCALCPASISETRIPTGHEYRHYTVGAQLYYGVFVGADADEDEKEEEY